MSRKVPFKCVELKGSTRDKLSYPRIIIQEKMEQEEIRFLGSCFYDIFNDMRRDNKRLSDDEDSSSSGVAEVPVAVSVKQGGNPMDKSASGLDGNEERQVVRKSKAEHAVNRLTAMVSKDWINIPNNFPCPSKWSLLFSWNASGEAVPILLDGDDETKLKEREDAYVQLVPNPKSFEHSLDEIPQVLPADGLDMLSGCIQPWIYEPLKKMGRLTPVQRVTIPASLAGFDVVSCAPTGTGKTHAALVPLIARVSFLKYRRSFEYARKNRGDRTSTEDGARHKPLAVIIEPTKELAQQCKDVLDIYSDSFRSTWPECGDSRPLRTDEQEAVLDMEPDSSEYFQELHRMWMASPGPQVLSGLVMGGHELPPHIEYEVKMKDSRGDSGQSKTLRGFFQDVLVGTIGRLADTEFQLKWNARDVIFWVLDEFDQLISSNDVQTFLQSIRLRNLSVVATQSTLMSATFAQDLLEDKKNVKWGDFLSLQKTLYMQSLPDPGNEMASKVNHSLIRVSDRNEKTSQLYIALHKVVDNWTRERERKNKFHKPKVVIFCNYKEDVIRLVKRLRAGRAMPLSLADSIDRMGSWSDPRFKNNFFGFRICEQFAMGEDCTRIRDDGKEENCKRWHGWDLASGLARAPFAKETEDGGKQFTCLSYVKLVWAKFRAQGEEFDPESCLGLVCDWKPKAGEDVEPDATCPRYHPRFKLSPDADTSTTEDVVWPEGTFLDGQPICLDSDTELMQLFLNENPQLNTVSSIFGTSGMEDDQDPIFAGIRSAACDVEDFEETQDTDRVSNSRQDTSTRMRQFSQFKDFGGIVVSCTTYARGLNLDNVDAIILMDGLVNPDQASSSVKPFEKYIHQAGRAGRLSDQKVWPAEILSLYEAARDTDFSEIGAYCEAMIRLNRLECMGHLLNCSEISENICVQIQTGLSRNYPGTLTDPNFEWPTWMANVLFKDRPKVEDCNVTLEGLIPITNDVSERPADDTQQWILWSSKSHYTKLDVQSHPEDDSMYEEYALVNFKEVAAEEDEEGNPKDWSHELAWGEPMDTSIYRYLQVDDYFEATPCGWYYARVHIDDLIERREGKYAEYRIVSYEELPEVRDNPEVELELVDQHGSESTKEHFVKYRTKCFVTRKDLVDLISSIEAHRAGWEKLVNEGAGQEEAESDDAQRDRIKESIAGAIKTLAVGEGEALDEGGTSPERENCDNEETAKETDTWASPKKQVEDAWGNGAEEEDAWGAAAKEEDAWGNGAEEEDAWGAAATNGGSGWD